MRCPHPPATQGAPPSRARPEVSRSWAMEVHPSRRRGAPALQSSLAAAAALPIQEGRHAWAGSAGMDGLPRQRAFNIKHPLWMMIYFALRISVTSLL